jgi:hypothetical protein
MLDPEDTESLLWDGWFEFEAGDLTPPNTPTGNY